jgi:hypothetical protein
VIDAWTEAHSGEHGISEDEVDDIWAWMQTQPLSPPTLKEARANARRH